MELARVEVRLTAAGTPTRRAAPGPCRLGPGAGPELLAALGGALADELDADDLDELVAVLHRALGGTAPPRSWLRHRSQTDTVGLRPAVHRLVADGARRRLECDPGLRTSPDAHAVALVAAAWTHPDRRRLLGALLDGAAGTAPGDTGWAARTLGVGPGAGAREVQRAFRRRLRAAHPDAGGDGAAVDDLVAARRALLAGPAGAAGPAAPAGQGRRP